MSEDEAIKELKEALEYKKTNIDTIEDPIQREIEENCYIWEMPFKAIDTILDLYEKEKEKNKDLEELLQVRQEGGLFERLFDLYNYYKDLVGSYQSNYISKDEIRDMRRYREFELQQEYKDFENDVEWKTYNKILEEAKDE